MSVSRTSPSKRSVVIVEDEPDLADLLAQLLASVDCASHIVSGRQAAERIRAHRPDAVILDYSMPGMSGQDVVRQLRSEHGEGVPPILLITGMPNAHALSRDMGADAFLRKPFDLDDFLAVMERLMPGSGTTEAVL